MMETPRLKWFKHMKSFNAKYITMEYKIGEI